MTGTRRIAHGDVALALRERRVGAGEPLLLLHALAGSSADWGLAVDAGVERCWRDCCMLTAIDGTANVQRLIIGRELLGMPAFV